MIPFVRIQGYEDCPHCKGRKRNLNRVNILPDETPVWNLVCSSCSRVFREVTEADQKAILDELQYTLTCMTDAFADQRARKKAVSR